MRQSSARGSRANAFLLPAVTVDSLMVASAREAKPRYEPSWPFAAAKLGRRAILP